MTTAHTTAHNNAPEKPRNLPVTGGHNLRDLGGYKTSDGRHVKWHTLYRSGAIFRLTEDDRAYMRQLGITAICDLRTPEERQRKPMNWHDGLDVHYFGGVALVSAGELERMIDSGTLEQASMMEMIHEVYRKLPFEQAQSYRHLFHMLAQGRVPLLFNCSAGKDRTGIAAALVLTALGVPRETIAHDYTLTNAAIDGLEQMMRRDPRYAGLNKMAREDYLPLLDAHPSYLEIAFGEIERQCGSVAAYMENTLGAGPAEIEAIRSYLLE